MANKCPDCKKKCFKSLLNKAGKEGWYYCIRCCKYFSTGVE